MNPNDCAKKIIKAIDDNVDQKFIGGFEIRGVFTKYFFPKYFYKRIRYFYSQIQKNKI